MPKEIVKKVVWASYYDSYKGCRGKVELLVPVHFVQGQLLTAFKKTVGYSHAHYMRDITFTERRV